MKDAEQTQNLRHRNQRYRLHAIARPRDGLTRNGKFYRKIGQGRSRDGLVNDADQALEFGALGITRIRQWIVQDQAESPWARKQHDDAGRHFHRFLDVVRDHEDGTQAGARRVPEADQFLAQVFTGQHIQGTERLVKTQQLRLGHQGSRNTNPLSHAA